MKIWKVDSDGESWTIEAPDDATEAEVNQFAADNYAGWVNGGRYRMDLADAPTGPAPAAAPVAPAGPQKEDYDRAVALLDKQIAALNKQRKVPSPGETLGGRSLIHEPELDKQIAGLTELRDKFAIGSTGQTVGGIGGALAGGGTGALIGGAIAGPPGMVVGGLLGSIAGGAAGVAAGTHLWDIPAARETREVTDQDAAELIRQRAIEAVIWDGAFVLILGPGGRVIGKMTKGARFMPALKAAAKEAVAWDELPKVAEKQLAGVVEKRAAQVPPGMATQVSRALGEPTKKTTQEAAEDLVADIAARSGGRVPTKGEMSGIVRGTEGFARRQSPLPFFENDRILADTAESIRNTALKDLDVAGAVTGPEFGEAIKRVADSANRSLKSTTAPIFERAAREGVAVDMTPTVRYLEGVLAKDKASANALLAPGERARIETMLAGVSSPTKFGLRGASTMTAEGVQDFVSGQKAALRGATGDGTKPGEYMAKVLRDLVEVADSSYQGMLERVNPALRRDLTQARKLYKDTLGDLYADAMAVAASKTPEDVGRALTAKGTVTEIRELRAALDRAVSGAPGKARYKGGVQPENLKELSKAQMQAEHARIDAGLIKGFIEKQTQTLDNLPQKLRDADFRLTLKELLTGKGVADPALGQKVLDELDRTAGVLKLIRPEHAPQPGRALGASGVGSVGATTAVSGVTGQPIQVAAPVAIGGMRLLRYFGQVMATAMTSGNTGVLRQFQRALMLSQAAGSNVAAAEAARAAWRELGIDMEQETP